MVDTFYFTDGKHRIGLPIECFIRHDNEFIAFEIVEDWYRHSLKCDDCKAFLTDMLPTKENIKWYLENNPFEKWFFSDGERYYKLMSNNFSTNGYFDNKISSIIGYRTNCKLKIQECDAPYGYLKYFEGIENYELCAFIRDNG